MRKLQMTYYGMVWKGEEVHAGDSKTFDTYKHLRRLASSKFGSPRDPLNGNAS